MIKFFQIVFLIASVILIVINVIEFNKWQEGKKEGTAKPHPIKWFPFKLNRIGRRRYHPLIIFLLLSGQDNFFPVVPARC